MLSIPPFSHKQSGNRVAPRRYDSALSSPLDAACACVSQVEKEHAGEGGTAHWNSRGRQPKTGTGSTSGLTGRGFPKVGGGGGASNGPKGVLRTAPIVPGDVYVTRLLGCMDAGFRLLLLRGMSSRRGTDATRAFLAPMRLSLKCSILSYRRHERHALTSSTGARMIS